MLTGFRGNLTSAISFLCAAGAAVVAKRIIPCLDMAAGRVVKGVNFVGLRLSLIHI